MIPISEIHPMHNNKHTNDTALLFSFKDLHLLIHPGIVGGRFEVKIRNVFDSKIDERNRKSIIIDRLYIG